MAFITASFTRRLRASLLALCAVLALGLVLSGRVAAAEIEVSEPQWMATDDGYTVAANFQFELQPRLEEAVTKGVPLYFVIDFELLRPRWYWFDEKFISRSQTVRLSYHALTRQYRVSNGGLHQSFATLSEAVQRVSRLRNWVVIDKSAERQPKPGDSYQGMVRIRLDINQLPKPFQIAAVGSREWTLTSDWKSWDVVIPVVPVTSAGESK